MRKQVRKLNKASTLLLLAAFALVGCAPVQRYHPVPISPVETASSLQARSLLDPGLRKFVEKNLSESVNPWPPKQWNLNLLTLAALYFSPVLEEARARLSAAQAAVVTAGARPNPSISLQPGIPSPYLFSLNFLVPIQTAGKRRIRVEQAKDLTREARLSLGEAAWKVRSNVRSTLLHYFSATRQVRLLRLEEGLQRRHVELLQQRLTVGELPRPTVDSARLELLRTRVALEAAQGRVPETLASLAAALGVPVAALQGINFSWPDFEHPPAAASLSLQRIQRDAVLNRLDVRRALAAYAASQAALQLEIAKQHPNFQLGPGYQFEETHSYFTLGYSVTLPLFNRNQGPIAEAEARRKTAAAAFLATQAKAIAVSEEALARYWAAMRVLKETERTLAQLEHVVVPNERRAVTVGEASHLALNAVLLRRPALAQAWLTALGGAQSALGTLEDAVERPLEPGEVSPPSSQRSALKGSRLLEGAKP